MAQHHHQGRDVSWVGERNVVHHGGPVDGHVPRSSGEDVSLRHASIDMLRRFKALRQFSSTPTHFCSFVIIKETNHRKNGILLIFLVALCAP